MLAQTRLVTGALLASGTMLTLLTAACDKVPLLAPQGTVITLFASNTVLPLNGSVDITATAIEAGSSGGGTTPPPTTPGTPGTPAPPATPTPATPGSGTPVHNGTVITFTTTLGRIEPAEARTHNGQATVRLISTGQSGTARVIAFSGGARSAEVTVLVGAAAVTRVDLTANPVTLPSTGGTSDLTARVFDTSGNAAAGIPVSFAITAGSGSLSQPSGTTDANGIARTILTTNRETTVTASAGVASGPSTPGSPGTPGTPGTPGSTPGLATGSVTVRVNTASTLAITTTTTNPIENQPVSFTITPAGGPGTTPIIRNVAVNFGDGTRANLGTISTATSVSHLFTSSGSFQVTASGTDTNGEEVTGSIVVVVNDQLPLAVQLTATPTSARRGVDTVTFNATVTGGSPIRFIWNFGDGTTAETTGGQVSHFYAATVPTGPVTVSVRVLSNNAGEGLGQTTVIITTP